ncbi:MAG: MBL fold metallo-hydrolase [Rhodobacterales bacterium]|nr:MAG: MBL fold metallo-hydrolase [Rhodobacterales bacterium]
MTDMPTPGQPETLAPGFRRILAPNPSPLTYWGTNSFLVGEGDVTLVDPGPNDPVHLAALIAALAPGERIAQIVVTHAHTDHSPGARPLSETTGAPVLAFGDALTGRSETMQRLAAEGLAAGGEGLDLDFQPDVRLADGERFNAGGLELETLWTPGHSAAHICLASGDTILTGDHVFGWASTFISPPDGDLTAFMQSCEKLLARAPKCLLPAHGNPIDDPQARLTWLMDHRRAREAQLLAALAKPGTARALTARVYTDIDPAMLPAAERNLFAHLIDLTTRGKVTAHPHLTPTATFSRAE